MIRTAWLALLIASMPVIVDTLDHVRAHSWAWYAFAFPVCAVLAIREPEDRPHRPILAAGLIAFGLVLEVVAAAAGMLRFGRPGVLLAAAGILAADGRLDLRRFGILMLSIPVPHVVLERMSEPLLSLNTEALVLTLRVLGIPALGTALGVERPSGLVVFESSDAGWTSAILALGLAWFFCPRRGHARASTVLGLGAAALVGLAVHQFCTAVLFALVEPASVADVRVGRDVLCYVAIAIGSIGYWVPRTRIAGRSGVEETGQARNGTR